MPALAEDGTRLRRWTHDAIVTAARRWEQEMGRPPTEVDWNPAHARNLMLKLHARIQTHVERIQAYEGDDWPSSWTARREFGSFNAMLEAAGFESRAPGRQPRDLDPKRERELRQHGQFDGPVTPAVLAVKLRKLAEARQANDQWALRASLYELAATAIAWVDQLDQEPQEDADAA
jgi:hypothetical protein